MYWTVLSLRVLFFLSASSIPRFTIFDHTLIHFSFSFFFFLFPSDVYIFCTGYLQQGRRFCIGRVGRPPLASRGSWTNAIDERKATNEKKNEIHFVQLDWCFKPNKEEKEWEKSGGEGDRQKKRRGKVRSQPAKETERQRENGKDSAKYQRKWQRKTEKNRETQIKKSNKIAKRATEKPR